MGNLLILEENWQKLKEKVIMPLWIAKFKGMYEHAKMDYDDFESLAALEFTKAIKNFDSTKSNLFTYATNILQRKAKTELTFYHRDRRIGNLEAESINKIADNNAKITIEDVIATRQESEISYLVNRYIASLPKMQKNVAELIIDGYDEQSIKSKLRLSDDRFKMIIQRMRAEEKVEPLKKMKGVTI